MRLVMNPALLSFPLLLGLVTSASRAASDPHLAVNDPDKFAWQLFQQINRPLDPAKPDGLVAWEGWALASAVFSNPDQAPSWPAVPPATRRFEDMDRIPLQQLIFNRQTRDARSDAEILFELKQPGPGAGRRPFVDPEVLQGHGNETRMNRATFDFIVANELYNVEGQERFFQENKPIVFPNDGKKISQEIKAQWRRIKPENRARYHTAIVRGRDGSEELWGLTALHITTKDLPNWFWATWEHRDNPGLDSVVPSRDSQGLPSELRGTKWENYVLRGTQIDFVDATGRPTILANSQIERGFQDSSSCITCHARASIGPKPRIRFERGQNNEPMPASVGANRLPVFEGDFGAIGVPDPQWYFNTNTSPPARRYLQTDFVWSLFRAGRKSGPVVQPRVSERPSPMVQQVVARLRRPAHVVDREETPLAWQPGPPRHPKLKLEVRLPEGRRIPPELMNFVKPGARRFASDLSKSRVVQLDTMNLELFRENVLDLSQLTVARPPDIGPPVHGRNRVRNLDARISHLVPELQATYQVLGDGITAAVFDEGAVRATHREFRTDLQDPGSTRVSLRTTASTSRHSTHVAGTMAASGVNPQALGMAPNLSVLSFDWERDLDNLRLSAGDFQVSNHSYGPASGWEQDRSNGNWYWWGDRAISTLEDAKFGQYSADASVVDEILHDNPELVTIVAAGNDRNDTPPTQPFGHYVIGVNPITNVLEWQFSNEFHQADNADNGGLDTVAGLGVAKNVICVGSVEDVTQPDRVIGMTSYSCWGPTDDNRIKPDLVANGDWLLSTSNADDLAYANLPGTSMASPTTAGIAALLCQQFEQAFGRRPTSAEIKAILIHTADDAGNPGPDPMFGWGSVNALRAGHVVASANGELVRSDEVGKNEVRTFRLRSTGEHIRVTVVWTDPAAPANSNGDDPTPVLQNDLDLTLTDPDGSVSFPYSLVATAPLSPATATGPNTVDNVEVIDADAHPGEWRIEVRARELRVGSRQAFALVLSGLQTIEGDK